jgi:PIN domain nuclease of toxin-antitoxin system
MIILDTHIWVWWIHKDKRLTSDHIRLIQENEAQGLGVSVISCWEVAKLIELKRLILPVPTKDWFDKALNYSRIFLLNLTPEIALESTQLPTGFHNDPAEQIIVATARIYDSPLLTVDAKIRAYAHVKILN